MDYLEPFFLFTLFFSVVIVSFAYFCGKIDSSAVLASGFVGFGVMFFLLDRWPLIYLVLAFFVLGNFVTRYRHSVKEKYDVAEGVRSFRNVFGNGGAATIFSILYFLYRFDFLLAGVVGAMAAATADTFATEIGQVYERRPRLITNLKPVAVGTSGAVSLYGFFAAFVGSFFVSLIPLVFFGSGFSIVFVGTVAGFLGCVFDSFIGATLEKRLMDTHLTNFFATSFAGVVAVFLSVYLNIFI